MKRLSLVIILLSLLPLQTTQANCDLTRFRWDCEQSVTIKPKSYATSLIHCGHVSMYLTKAQYDTLARYQRVNVNMSIMVDGEYLDGPCVPAGR
jgi:hypothetical protein